MVGDPTDGEFTKTWDTRSTFVTEMLLVDDFTKSTDVAANAVTESNRMAMSVFIIRMFLR